MSDIAKKKVVFQKKMYILGFGGIAQALLPLIFRHFDILPSQIYILSKEQLGMEIAQKFGITLHIKTITQQNYQRLIGNMLQQGDFVINLTVGVSSLDLIGLCRKKEVLYIDTCTEPWEGVYTDKQLSPNMRTNYALRDAVLNLKHLTGPTAVITHGANPGLVSHFVKQALWNMANDNELAMHACPQTSAEWASLACSLNIKTIQIAERDTQVTDKIKTPNEFVNTWSADGFISEASQPAELGWGTHERHWPQDGHHHVFGSRCVIYLECPGGATKVRTWVPSLGASHGFLISHAETISISDYLTKRDGNEIYRPTVHYAYIPCPDAILSIHELYANEWSPQKHKRLISDDVVDGMDELGVLLMGNKKGAYWYGSQLSIQKTHALASYNNATSLQVVIAVIAGIQWAIEHPDVGTVEPEDIDYQYILRIAKPYLGRVGGYYTDWNPLQKREELFKEELDHTDPWQFLNIRVK